MSYPVKHQIGKMRDRAVLLRLLQEPDEVSWEAAGNVWAKAERQTGGNIFSSVGLSAESWKVTIRARDMTMHDALELDGRHHFITAIDKPERGFFEIMTARVKMTACQTEPGAGGLIFPAALTEKYVRHEQLSPMADNTVSYVLVTPKCVDLEEGRLVKADGLIYEIQTAHRLDEYKNEFEIVRRWDL